MVLSTEVILTLQQLDGVGNKTIFKLANQVSAPIYNLGQLCDFWKSLKGKKVEAISKEDLEEAYHTAQRIMTCCEQNGVGVMSYYEDCFPKELRVCVNETGKLDPPILLYYEGNIKVFERPGIAVIGTREPTVNGVHAGKYFSSEFAKNGYNIVSGLAVGCDAAGHQGALEAGGVTTAFLANGLDWESIYPKENLELARNIIEKGGLLLSEYPVGQSCGRYGLVARDRLQAGLSYATVVIQTGEKGGTMHAVNATINSGKLLFAVEYKNGEDATHEKVQGNVKLIREGKAHPLRSASIDEAIQMCEKAYKTGSKQIQQTSLFD